MNHYGRGPQQPYGNPRTPAQPEGPCGLKDHVLSSRLGRTLRVIAPSPYLLALLAFGSLASGIAALAAPPSGPSLPVRAQALLAKRCLSCHGTAAMGGLDLRARAALLRGGG